MMTLTPEARAETAYAVDSRALLVTFDTRLPSFVTGLRLIRGLQPGEGILGIDFRPANRRLYALGSSSRLYTIDTESGVATLSAPVPSARRWMEPSSALTSTPRSTAFAWSAIAARTSASTRTREP